MNRGMMGMATMVALCVASQSADAQVYIYDAPTTVYVPGGVYSTTVYPQPVVVQSGAVVSSNYYAPAYAAPAGVVQMSYRSPVLVPARTVIAAPVNTAPEPSVTMPEIDPVKACENRNIGKNMATTSAQ